MSNKTPNETDAATESAPKNIRKKNPLIGMLLVAFGLVLLISGISGLFDGKQRLVAPNGTVLVEIADTAEERVKGLSGRKSMGDKEGMLFVFEQPSENHCIWMKDMQFPIDIVWLDDAKRVVTVKEAVAPETYDDTFCPTESARYVLEVTSTQAKNLGIEPGVTLRW